MTLKLIKSAGCVVVSVFDFSWVLWPLLADYYYAVLSVGLKILVLLSCFDHLCIDVCTRRYLIRLGFPHRSHL